MNQVIMIGRLTKEPELNTTASGVSVCRFSIAVDRKTKQGDEKVADFFNVVAWRGIGETCHKYLKKGRKCCVSGRLENRSYQAQDGSTRYVTEIITEDVEFLDGANGSNNNEQPKPTKQQDPEVKAIFEPLDEDSLPF